MWPYHPDLLAVPVPRYTSFPTAAEFSDDVGADDYCDAIEAASGRISLYLHIPFCEKICWYCGCNTGAANRIDRVTSYLDALHREIALVGQRLPRGTRIGRIAFGGGSPNAISPIDLVRLMDAMTLHLPLDDPEISIELDPRTMTQQWADILGALGVTRASLGVQTFAPHLQQAIGRIQPVDTIRRTVEWLRRAGGASLNLDLMYGLPGQDERDLAESLAETMALGADRIALFGYAHVPHLIARQKRIDGSKLPGQRERFDMAALGYDTLAGAGYVPVGFDHFALAGDPLAGAVRCGRLRRNFQGFTDDDSQVLLGLGASAISSFPGLHLQNEKNAGRYRMRLSQRRLTASRGVRRSAEDRARGVIIEQLLCRGQAWIGAERMGRARSQLRPFVERGLAEIADEGLRILPAGLPYARSIAAVFDPYRQDSVRRFSSAI